MTLQEFIKKKELENRKIYDLLKDDRGDGIVYHLYQRIRNKRAISIGIFSRFSNSLHVVKDDLYFELNAYDDDFIKNKTWFEVRKYRLMNDEYELDLLCDISNTGKLLKYPRWCNALKDFKFVSEEDVLPPYGNGDIIKIKNAPFSNDFYAIYIYDNARSGNKHIQLQFSKKDGFFCSKIFWFESTEKADICRNPRVNKMSKKIKGGYDDFKTFCEENDIPYSIQPF